MVDRAETNPQDTDSQAVTTGGAKEPPQRSSAGRPQRQRGGSTLEIISGVRRVKGYPLSRDELLGVGGAGLLATTCFSIGGTYINRAYDIQKDLEFSQGVTNELKIRWETKEADSWFFGAVLITIGVVAIIAGGAKVLSIIKSTTHPDI